MKSMNTPHEKSFLSILVRIEPRSHFISRLSMMVRVNAALNRTVVESD